MPRSGRDRPTAAGPEGKACLTPGPGGGLPLTSGAPRQSAPSRDGHSATGWRRDRRRSSESLSPPMAGTLVDSSGRVVGLPAGHLSRSDRAAGMCRLPVATGRQTQAFPDPPGGEGPWRRRAALRSGSGTLRASRPSGVSRTRSGSAAARGAWRRRHARAAGRRVHGGRGRRAPSGRAASGRRARGRRCALPPP